MTDLPTSLFRLTREQRNLSLRDLAAQAKISKSAIIRTEQALYSSPAQALIDFFDLNPSLAMQSYRKQQLLTRQYHGPAPVLVQGDRPEPYRMSYLGKGVAPYFKPNAMFDFMRTMQFPVHPMQTLLNGRSYLSFAKAFCVPPDVLRRWIEEPWQVKTVPTSILDALKEAGYGELFLNHLRHAYMTIYKRKERCGTWCSICYPNDPIASSSVQQHMSAHLNTKIMETLAND